MLGFFGFSLSSIGSMNGLPVPYWAGLTLVFIAVLKGIMDLRTQYLQQKKIKKETDQIGKD